MTKRQKELVCRSFKRDFPEFVSLAEKMGLRIQNTGKAVNDMPTYWLDGRIQLTGYRTTNGGTRFTKQTATEHIRKTLMQIAEGRDEVSRETREQRFARVIDGMMAVPLQYGNFCHYTHPSGDDGCILFMGSGPVTAWVRLWDEQENAAHVEDFPRSEVFALLNTSFANGGKTISSRKPGRAA